MKHAALGRPGKWANSAQYDFPQGGRVLRGAVLTAQRLGLAPSLDLLRLRGALLVPHRPVLRGEGGLGERLVGQRHLHPSLLPKAAAQGGGGRLEGARVDEIGRLG